MKRITMIFLGLVFVFSANAQDLKVATSNEKVVQPEVPKAVIFDQSDITTSGFSSIFANLEGPEGEAVYATDDFSLPTPTNITSITAYGFANGYDSPQNFLDSITGVNLYIYSNSALNTPDGDPLQSGTGLLELEDLDPNGTSVNITSPSPGQFNFSIDIQEALGSDFELPAGNYWLVVAPNMDVSVANGDFNWNWYDTAQPNAGVNEGHLLAPKFDVNDWLSYSDAGLSLGSTAFIIEGDVVGEFAQVQVVHNAPDPAASVVDVYVNGDLAIDDFEFRTATSFLALPAGVDLDIDIAPGTSADVSESLFTATVNLVENENYIVVADGVLDPTQFDDSVNAIDFNLEVYEGARQEAATSGNTDVLVHHGAPDAPTVDVVNQADGNVLVDDISYPEFQGYLELPTDDYLIDVTTADNSTKVAGYQAYLADLGLDDAAITVFASGFLDPSVNQDGPAFGLWVSLASGGPLVELNDEDFVPFPAPYCGPLDYGSVEPITNVEFGGIENRSDASLGGSPAHEDFTEISSDVLIQEESYDIILEGNTGGSFENAFVVFIDWNQDGVFDGEDEVIEIIQTIDNSNGEDGQQAIQSIEVPANALNGETRMRIKKFFFVNDLPSDYLDPCVTSSTFGQAEDYTLNVGTLSNDNFDSKDFSYYPNPVKDVLSISTASTVENIKVYNMLGQQVKETAPNSSNPQINLSEFNSGVYLVSLEVEGNIQTFRVMKQ